MPKAFQNLGENDIHIPSFKADPSGLCSYDVLSDTILVPSSPPNFSTLHDIVRVTLDGLELQNDRCRRHTFWVNNMSSRCAINIMQIEGSDPLPGDMHFVIRQSCHCVPTVRFDGVWAPNNGGGFAANGLLVQIGGLLGQAWEIQAEIVPNVQNLAPNGYRVVFEFSFDRLGDNNQAIKGPLTTGTLLPP